jgi:hypothetical protein
VGDGSEELNRRELLRDGLMAGGAAAIAGVSSAAAGAPSAAAADPPSVQLALARHWPWGAKVDPARPFYLSPDTRGPTRGGGSRRGIDAPLVVMPFVLLVDVGSPPKVSWPFHVHVEISGGGLAAKAVGQNVRFPRRPPHRVTTREWLGIFPVRLARGTLQLVATLHRGAGGPAAELARSHVGDAGDSTVTVSGDFAHAPVTSSLLAPEQVSLLESIARESEIPFDTNNLLDVINGATHELRGKLQVLKQHGSSTSIADMFEMQMLMNKLSQLSEISTSVTDATTSAISEMKRNVK